MINPDLRIKTKKIQIRQHQLVDLVSYKDVKELRKEEILAEKVEPVKVTKFLQKPNRDFSPRVCFAFNTRDLQSCEDQSGPRSRVRFNEESSYQQLSYWDYVNKKYQTTPASRNSPSNSMYMVGKSRKFCEPCLSQVPH